LGRDIPFDFDFKDRPNLVGVSKGTGNGRSLILNGHIDVIPVEPLGKLEKDPWGAEIGGAPYGYDASFLNHRAKTPTLIFGPGSIAQAHTINEFIKIDEVITATKVLAIFMLDWCGYE